MSRLVVLYDEQCEICQAGVAWIAALDVHHRIDCQALQTANLVALSPELSLDMCMEQLHVVQPAGEVIVGWNAVMAVAQRLPRLSWLAKVDSRIGPLNSLGDRIYRKVASSRWQLSRCRGGACSVDQVGLTRAKAGLGTFWTCYTVGLLARLPLIAAAGVGMVTSNFSDHLKTRGRRIELLDGRLQILFLTGFPTDVVPLLFGERFTAVVHRGLAVDPGSIRMRSSITDHLEQMPDDAIKAVAATHHHEEHVGNLDWLADSCAVPLYVNDATATFLRPPATIPLSRRAVIGQPPALSDAALPLESHLTVGDSRFEVIRVPGHTSDHVAFYDPRDRVLLAGDSFMGAWFFSPNSQVDSKAWMESIDRLLELDIDVMVEAHGHVYSTSDRIPDIPGVVIRTSPREALQQKRDMMQWVRSQVIRGQADGLGDHAIEATCFPWGQRWSWELKLQDELARLVTFGGFSRTELIRSFVRTDDEQLLPQEYRLRVGT